MESDLSLYQVIRKPSCYTGVEIRGRPVVQDHHFLGKDDLVLTDGSPFKRPYVIVICGEGRLRFW